MKICEILREMTMKHGTMENQLSIYFKSIIKDEKNYKHVGDIEQIKVLKNNDIYLLITDDKPIAFFQVTNSNNVADLQNAYTIPELRKTGIFTKFIWFLKRNEGYNQIRFGDVHSEDTIEVIKAISKRFDTYWQNGKGEKIPYDVNTIDQFYSKKHPTDWKIILENNYDFSDWPKFYEVPNIKCIYEGII